MSETMLTKEQLLEHYVQGVRGRNPGDLLGFFDTIEEVCHFFAKLHEKYPFQNILHIEDIIEGSIDKPNYRKIMISLDESMEDNVHSEINLTMARGVLDQFGPNSMFEFHWMYATPTIHRITVRGTWLLDETFCYVLYNDRLPMECEEPKFYAGIKEIASL